MGSLKNNGNYFKKLNPVGLRILAVRIMESRVFANQIIVSSLSAIKSSAIKSSTRKPLIKIYLDRTTLHKSTLLDNSLPKMFLSKNNLIKKSLTNIKSENICFYNTNASKKRLSNSHEGSHVGSHFDNRLDSHLVSNNFSKINLSNKLSARKIFVSSVIATSLVACGDFKNEKEAITTLIPQEKSIRSQTVGDAKFILQETEIPHQYQLAISWPEEIKKVVIENNGKKIFDTDSTRQYLLSLKDNTQFMIRAFSYDGMQPVLIGETEGSTPKDYSISGNFEIKEDTEIQAYRVFLVNEPNIQTNGKLFKIKATKIFSDNAKIISFPQGTKAPFQTNGASGGSVHFISKQAAGHVRIHLRGQHGGDGINGLPWVTRAADGGAGGSGNHDCLRPGFIGGPIKCWCTRNPDKGGDGAAGAKGRNGTMAGRGGNSGLILIEITDPSEFAAEPIQEIGLAGTAGRGGPGQEGGNGGPAGDPTSGECPNASNGNKGATGPNGDVAPPALDGSTETLCISIGQGEAKCQIK